MSKISDDLYFSHFSQFLLFLYLFFLNIFPDARPLILDARGRSSPFTHLPLLFRHIPMHFFNNSVVWCPRLDTRGRRTPPPTLHATASRPLVYNTVLDRNQRFSILEIITVSVLIQLWVRNYFVGSSFSFEFFSFYNGFSFQIIFLLVFTY